MQITEREFPHDGSMEWIDQADTKDVIGAASSVRFRRRLRLRCHSGSIFSRRLKVQQEHNRARHHGFWVGTFCIFVLATVQIICFGWIWGIKNGAAELDQGALIRIPRLFLFVMKWVAPVYLLVVLGGFTYFDLRAKVKDVANDPVALATVVVIGAVLALLIALLAVGERRWRAAGLDIDGRRQ